MLWNRFSEGRGTVPTGRPAAAGCLGGPAPCWEKTMFMCPAAPAGALDTAMVGRACWMVRPGAPGRHGRESVMTHGRDVETVTIAVTVIPPDPGAFARMPLPCHAPLVLVRGALRHTM